MIIEQKDCHGIKCVVKLILKMETVIPFKTQMIATIKGEGEQEKN